jgi:hypothetical protein
LEARRAAAIRRAKEAAIISRTTIPAETSSDFVVDEELSRLPDKYRAPIVLCDLEGMTRKDAARQLGWAEGTVASRLARGRSLLARRLTRRGLGAALTAVLVTDRTWGCVPSALLSSTLSATRFSATREAASQGLLSTAAAGLTEGVLKAMLVTKIKIVCAAVLLCGIVGLGSGRWISQTLAVQPQQETSRPNSDDARERVLELKQQLLLFQTKITQLERETQFRHGERKPDVGFLADRFKYQVPFEIGRTQTSEGGRIEIQEVWGTRPLIEIGGQYLVRGKYVMPAGVKGKLYFYATASGPWGAVTTTLDLQSVDLSKPEGEFALVHGMSGPGYFHLILTEADRYSRYFSDVYFGTGENVWRKKP